ncbi:hypothetical protein AB1Y20_012499 [Prymnesium parvum]|uniref:RNA helicase n=1 Tax=Prymnesium parvum TaxID=97485 RepID=A0AB34IK08_PRYPA
MALCWGGARRSRARLLLVGLTMPRSLLAHQLVPRLRPPLSPSPRHASVRAADFASLGVSPPLLSQLRAMGFDAPTDPQAQAFPAILSGDDVVLLAETGTGKTLAYALPIAQRMLERIEAEGAAAQQAVVLVPNRDLCEQVAGVIGRLFAGLPHPLSVSALTDDAADIEADVLVGTAATVLRYWCGPERVRWLVLDEADQLLAGSFKPAARSSYPVEQIIAQLKRDAKQAAEREGALRKAAAYGYDEAARAERARARAASWKASASSAKQFVVVGATMPNAGTRNAEVHVGRLFPLAVWLRGERVHREKAELRQVFVKVEPSQRLQALRLAIKQGPPGGKLVFTNSPDTAEEVHEELGGDAKGCALFHKLLPLAERRATLEAFREGRVHTLVCTGLASRGLDLSHVTHVVQYECAENAVEYMHRIGRTARAGSQGTATTIYTDERAELVEALREALEGGHSMDHLFSRKRSFRKHIKRYGSAAPVDWKEITASADKPLR